MLAMPQQEYIKFLYEEEELSIAEISRHMGINWRTAAKYANKDNWNTTLKKTKNRRPVMDPVAEIVDMWLLEDILKPRKERRSAAAVYAQLRKEYGFSGSPRTVRAYVSQRRKELRIGRQEKFLELEHPPGHAQADFGTARVIWDGKLRTIKYLAVSFPYSNAGFIVPVPSENMECFLHALTQVFTWIKGVPRCIRFDNFPAAVTAIGKKGQRDLTDAFRRFKLHYRFETEFCGIRKANEKGSVENKVGYTRRNWLIPYPKVTSFEQLAQKLHERALADLNRPHYSKGTMMAQLWQEEQKDLLPLPSIPFECVAFASAKVDKYCRIKCHGDIYHLPQAQVGETVLVKLSWDSVKILNQNQEHLGTFPRNYTFKAKPIDWTGYFAMFIKKPRATIHSSMYKFLPREVQNYIEEGEGKQYLERLKFIHTLLEEDYPLELIAKALRQAQKHGLVDKGLIRHLLYRFLTPERSLKALDDDHTPGSVRDYRPQISVYNRLMPTPCRKGGGANDQTVH